MIAKRHVMIVEGRFYDDLSDLLYEGARRVLEREKVSHERYTVPGALEIPAAISIVGKSRHENPFDAYIALGCVIRGETSHYDIVAGESARGLMDLSVKQGLAIGNGILTCENREQALERADPARMDKGGGAVLAALALLDLKEKFGVV